MPGNGDYQIGGMSTRATVLPPVSKDNFLSFLDFTECLQIHLREPKFHNFPGEHVPRSLERACYARYLLQATVCPTLPFVHSWISPSTWREKTQCHLFKICCSTFIAFFSDVRILNVLHCTYTSVCVYSVLHCSHTIQWNLR